jgi:hypothetical protein
LPAVDDTPKLQRCSLASLPAANTQRSLVLSQSRWQPEFLLGGRKVLGTLKNHAMDGWFHANFGVPHW